MGLITRIRNVFRRPGHLREIDREIAFHIEEATDRLAAQGMTREDAAREARRRFGHQPTARERTRDVGIVVWFESLVGDIRYAIRSLRQAPIFAAVAIVSLGLGIGANTAIFSLLNALALRSLPVASPEQLVKLSMGSETNDVFTNPLWEEIRKQGDAFDGLFAMSGQRFNLSPAGEARPGYGVYVSGQFFSTLRVSPAAGRLIQPADDQRGCSPIAVASYGFGRSEFGSAAGAVGKTLSLNGHQVPVVGVVAAGFTGAEVGRAPAFYLPLCSEAAIEGIESMLDIRAAWWLQIMGRVSAGSSREQVGARLAAASPEIFRATLPDNWGPEGQKNYLSRVLAVSPAATGLSEVRGQFETPLQLLMAVVGAVLLIACANVANLQLARAAARQREIAMRLAIGAGRRRIMRQMLTESVILALAGAALGVLFARWSTEWLMALIGDRVGQVSLDLSLSGQVLGFTLLVAVTTGILFGIAPAWRAVRLDPQIALRSGGPGATAGPASTRLGKALVVGQIALSLLLVAVAGLLLGTFRSLTRQNPGFDPSGVYLAEMQFKSLNLTDEGRQAAAAELLRQLRESPGNPSASGSLITPVSGRGWNSFLLTEGYHPASQYQNLVWFNGVTDGFFSTLGTPLIAGRDFTDQDQGKGQRVAIINQALATLLFGQKNPLGQRVWVQNEDRPEPAMEVIGVVGNARYRSLRDSDEPTVYLPWGQGEHFGSLTYEVRSSLPPADAVAGILAAAKAAVPAASLTISTLSDQVSRSLQRERLLALLSGFFGALALLLALIGQYGIMAYSVTRRRKELGIRVALGATRSGLVRLVVGEVTRMVLLGLVLGAVAVFFTTRLVTAMLYGRSPLDPLTLTLATASVAVAALVAGAIPAVRASRQDPQRVLREE